VPARIPARWNPGPPLPEAAQRTMRRQTLAPTSRPWGPLHALEGPIGKRQVGLKLRDSSTEKSLQRLIQARNHIRHETTPLCQPARALRRTARGLVHVFALLAAIAGPHAGWAAGASGTDVTARFVFQLLKYVSWPPSTVGESSPFVVGVLGDEALVA